MGFITNPTVSEWLETLLVVEQLVDDSVGGGFSQAGLIAIDGTIYSGDTVTIGVETYSVTIALTDQATLIALAADINLNSTRYYAHLTANLGDFFTSNPTYQLVIYRRTPTTAVDRFYGNVDALRVIAFNVNGYTSGQEINLPATDPTNSHFGPGRYLTREEVHSELENDTIWRWDEHNAIWIQIDASYIYYAGEVTFTGADLVYSDLTIFTSANHWGWARKTDNSILYLVRRVSIVAGDITDFRFESIDDETTIYQPFAFDTASPLDFSFVHNGGYILQSSIYISTVFDDAAATLQLTTTGATELQPVTANDPQTLGTYIVDNVIPILATEQFRLNITPGASTTGAGMVILRIRRI